LNLKFWKRNEDKSKVRVEKCPVCEGKQKIDGKKCVSCGGQGFIVLGQATRILTVEQKDAKNLNTNRNVNDVAISVLEGLDGNVAINVTGWDSDKAFSLFKQVRNEVKKK